MSVNSVVLIGRLTADPEIRTTQTGKQVANFSLAVSRRFKGQDGQDADFFSVSTWGNSADYVANYLGKGRLVAVEGRLQSRKYTTQDGSNREVVEVVAENVQGLDRPRDEAPTYSAPQPASGEADYDPFSD